MYKLPKAEKYSSLGICWVLGIKPFGCALLVLNSSDWLLTPQMPCLQYHTRWESDCMYIHKLSIFLDMTQSSILPLGWVSVWNAHKQQSMITSTYFVPLSSLESSWTSSPTPSPLILQPEPSTLDEPRMPPPALMMLEIPIPQPVDRKHPSQVQPSSSQPGCCPLMWSFAWCRTEHQEKHS